MDDLAGHFWMRWASWHSVVSEELPQCVMMSLTIGEFQTKPASWGCHRSACSDGGKTSPARPQESPLFELSGEVSRCLLLTFWLLNRTCINQIEDKILILSFFYYQLEFHIFPQHGKIFFAWAISSKFHTSQQPQPNFRWPFHWPLTWRNTSFLHFPQKKILIGPACSGDFRLLPPHPLRKVFLEIKFFDFECN